MYLPKIYRLFSIVLLLLLLLRAESKAQIVYVSMFNGDVYSVDPNICNPQFIGNTGLTLLDIAVCGGNLYGTAGTVLYSIDPITGSATFLSAVSQTINSIVCDGNGTLYVAGTDLFSYDIATGVWTLIAPLPFQSAGDLVFYNGNLYYSDMFNGIYLINLNPFSTQLSITFPAFQWWGLGTIPGTSCNGSELLLGSDGNPIIYSIDINTGATSTLCNMNMPNSIVTGLATEIVPPSSNGFTLSSLTLSPACNGYLTGSATVNVQGGLSPFTYLWPSTGGNTNTINNVAAGNYICIVTDSVGCTDTLSVSITQPPALAAAITGPAAGCAGTQVQFIANASGGSGTSTFQWLPGSQTGSTITISPAQTTTYILIATDSNGCTDTAQSVFTVWPLPTASFSTSQIVVCAGSTVTFTSTSTINPPDAITQWNWDFGNGNTTSGANVNPIFNTPGPVDVTLTVTSANGCSNSISQNAVITVNSWPEANFGYQITNAPGFNGQILFSDSSTGAFTWFWQFGDPDNSTSALQNPDFTYPASDCYSITLTVTDAAGCTDTTSEILCFNLETTLYVPNTFTPGGDSRNDIFIPVGENVSENNYLFRVYNRWGELLFETTSPTVGWDGTYKGGKVQLDTYVWTLEYYEANNRFRQQIGHVNVIRQN
jgi:gliding motility-associated-like protein